MKKKLCFLNLELHNYWIPVAILFLTYFLQILSFDIPWKRLKTKSFVMLLGWIKIEHWPEISQYMSWGKLQNCSRLNEIKFHRELVQLYSYGKTLVTLNFSLILYFCIITEAFITKTREILNNLLLYIGFSFFLYNF